MEGLMNTLTSPLTPSRSSPNQSRACAARLLPHGPRVAGAWLLGGSWVVLSRVISPLK